MADLELGIPEASVTDRVDLWLPDGLEYIQSWELDTDQPSGSRSLKHEFKFTFKGETQYFGVVAERGCSDDQIEDMAAGMAAREADRIIETLQKRGSKLIPEQLAEPDYWHLRRELAAIWRDFIQYARKRAETTTGRIYQSGVTL